MINFIVTYLFIGTIFMVCMELILDRLGNKTNVDQLRKDIGGWSRLLGIVLWPFGLMIFLAGYLITTFKNDKDELESLKLLQELLEKGTINEDEFINLGIDTNK